MKSKHASLRSSVFICILTFGILFSGCAPGPNQLAEQSAVEVAPTFEPESTVAPTLTPTLTQIPTLESTATQISTPTGTAAEINPEQQLSEYLQTEESKKEIAQLIKALKQAGIEITEDQVSVGLAYQEITDKDGRLSSFAGFNFDMDLSGQGGALEGTIPMFIFAKSKENAAEEWRPTSLKDLAELVSTEATLQLGLDGFKIGTLLIPDGTDRVLEIQSDEFNAGTANIYWNSREKQKGNYSWGYTSSQINLGNKNDMFLTLHPLFCWWANPDWLQQEIEQEKTPELRQEKAFELIDYRIEQIYNLLQQSYPDLLDQTVKIDLSNEFFYDTSQDIFLRYAGPDYLSRAGLRVNQLFPNAVLSWSHTYNHGSGQENTGPSQKAISQLQAAGVKNLAVGMHVHLKKGEQIDEQDFLKTIDGYGVPVFIEELDMDLSMFPEQAKGYQIQAENFSKIITAALASGRVPAISFWGVTDDLSWYVDQGKKNSDPLLIDSRKSKKLSYYAVLMALWKHLSASQVN